MKRALNIKKNNSKKKFQMNQSQIRALLKNLRMRIFKKLSLKNHVVFILITLFFISLIFLWFINSYSNTVLILSSPVVVLWLSEAPYFEYIKNKLKITNEKSNLIKLSICLLTAANIYEIVSNTKYQFIETGNTLFFFDQDSHIIPIRYLLDSKSPDTISLAYTNFSYFTFNSGYRDYDYQKENYIEFKEKNHLINVFLFSIRGYEYSQSPFVDEGTPLFTATREYFMNDEYVKNSLYSKYMEDEKKLLPIPKYEKMIVADNKIIFYGKCATEFIIDLTPKYLDIPIEEAQSYLLLLKKLEENLDRKIIETEFEYKISLSCPWYYSFSPELKSYTSWFNKITIYSKEQFNWHNVNKAIMNYAYHLKNNAK